MPIKISKKQLTEHEIVRIKVLVEGRHPRQQPHDGGALLEVVVVHQPRDLGVENVAVLVGETDDVALLEVLSFVENEISSRALAHQTRQSLRLKFPLLIQF